jgi:hypothetical protein
MAYTNPWNEAAPLGGAAAATLDDIVRQLKVDLRERLDDVLATGGKFTDDPILLSIPNRTGQILIVHPATAVGESGSDAVAYGDGKTAVSASAQPSHILVVPLPLIDYWKVTKVEVLLSRGSNANVTAEFDRASFDTSNTKTIIGTTTDTSSGLSVVVVFSGAETIASGFTYWVNLETSGANSMIFGGARITYDEV